MTAAPAPLIALISAVDAAIPPAAASISSAIPGARVWNLLDDRLLADANDAGGLTPALSARMERLIEHAMREGADGVLLTCSLYGPAAHGFPDADVPVLAADDAAFDAVASGGYRRVLVIASFAVALDDAVERLRSHLRAASTDVELVPAVAEAAFGPAKARDDTALLDALETAARPHAESVDAVLLAQYSLAPVADRLARDLSIPVISGPAAAAAILAERTSAAR